MATYKHTQIGYIIILLVAVVFVIFLSIWLSARAEPPSVDSGTNFLVTLVMVFLLFIQASFATLKTEVADDYFKLTFGWGIYSKTIALSDIVTAQKVKNHWYYGWGIRWWPNPRMTIYNVSGLDAVELVLQNGKRCRVGTDDPDNLAHALTGKKA